MIGGVYKKILMFSFLPKVRGFLGVLVLLMTACDNPVGLEPVSGVEGDIVLGDSLFRSLGATGLALVALDKLDPDSLGNHLLAYSDPILYDSTSTFPEDTTVLFFYPGAAARMYSYSLGVDD